MSAPMISDYTQTFYLIWLCPAPGRHLSPVYIVGEYENESRDKYVDAILGIGEPVLNNSSALALLDLLAEELCVTVQARQAKLPFFLV